MKPIRRRDILFLIFPKLRLLAWSYDKTKWLYDFFHPKKKNENKKRMKRPVKIAIGCLITMVVIVGFGFVAFPKMIKGKIKKMIVLDQASEIRKMFVKVPFPLDFKVYMFNVTNPMEVQNGALPNVVQIGPFCFEEWKEKVNIEDDEENDFMYYHPKDTFIKQMWPGCLDGEEMITMPHPMIVGMVNTVVRQKPAMLTLVNKALVSIFKNPTSVFLTAKAKDIMFDGVIIDCSVKDFAGKAVCTQLKTEAKDLRHVSENELAFSFFTPKNGTPGKKHKVLRGVKKSHDVGRIVEFDEKKEMEVWPTKECNQFKGTDGTIFPPLMTKEEGLASFAPDLCRALVAGYDSHTKYDGIAVDVYTADLGDMSKNADEKCFCLTPETCLKKGMMDLYKCAGVPIYVSLPHFYLSDPSYVNGVTGLTPNRADHGISIMFERMTGSPVSAKKRLQFNMPFEPNDKVPLFNKLPNTVVPLFWVEEGVALNNTFTGPLKQLMSIQKIVKITSWVILVGSLAGLGYSLYMIFGKKEMNTTPVHKVKPTDEANGVSTVNSDGFGGHVNHAMSENEIDKY